MEFVSIGASLRLVCRRMCGPQDGGQLASLRGELADTRKDLARESSRATRAHAKWDADKASLERAKDALAVALSQLDEAEARPITD